MIDQIRTDFPDAIIADGFDDAIIGLAENGGQCVVAYSYPKCVDILIQRDGMTREEAVEWMEYNVVGYIPYGGPVFVYNPYEE